MQGLEIYTNNYDIDIGRLFKSRIITPIYDEELSILGKNKIILFDYNTRAVADCLSDMLLYDIMQLVVADMVNEIDVGYSVKRDLLQNAVYYASKACIQSVVRKDLLEYLKRENSLNLEGYISFRMKDTVAIWQGCVNKVETEYYALLGQLQIEELIRELLGAEEPKQMWVIMRRDGTCTLVDQENSKIDYPAGAGESVMSMLLYENPSQLSVYDLTNGESELVKSITGVFLERIRLFR